jgi:hypothetical protein
MTNRHGVSAILFILAAAALLVFLPADVSAESQLSARLDPSSVDLSAGSAGKTVIVLVAGWRSDSSDPVEIVFPMLKPDGSFMMDQSVTVSPAGASLPPSSLTGGEHAFSFTLSAGPSAAESVYRVPVIVRQGSAEVQLSLNVATHGSGGTVPTGNATTMKHPSSVKPVIAAKTSGRHADFINALETAVRSSEDEEKIASIIVGSKDAARGAFDELLPLLEKAMASAHREKEGTVTIGEEMAILDTMVSAIATTFEMKLKDGSLMRRYTRMMEKSLGGHTASPPPADLIGEWERSEEGANAVIMEHYTFNEDGTFSYSYFKSGTPPVIVSYSGKYELSDRHIIFTDLKASRGSQYRDRAEPEREHTFELRPTELMVVGLFTLEKENYWKTFSKKKKQQ